jgi:hypothetical protein
VATEEPFIDAPWDFSKMGPIVMAALGLTGSCVLVRREKGEGREERQKKRRGGGEKRRIG